MVLFVGFLLYLLPRWLLYVDVLCVSLENKYVRSNAHGGHGGGAVMVKREWLYGVISVKVRVKMAQSPFRNTVSVLRVVLLYRRKVCVSQGIYMNLTCAKWF